MLSIEFIQKHAKREVANGVAFLDAKVPDWCARMPADLSLLNCMSISGYCVLDYAYGSFGDALRQLFGHAEYGGYGFCWPVWADRVNFCSPMGDDITNALNAEWRRVIAERRVY